MGCSVRSSITTPETFCDWASTGTLRHTTNKTKQRTLFIRLCSAAEHDRCQSDLATCERNLHRAVLRSNPRDWTDPSDFSLVLRSLSHVVGCRLPRRARFLAVRLHS